MTKPEGILDALKSLSEKHGAGALIEGFYSLQRAVKRQRKAKEESIGILAQTFTEAMRIWQIQKADGVSFEQRRDTLAASLKSAWPKGREWKYLCDVCDEGLVYYYCHGNSMCGRMFEHNPHPYGEPCECAKGAKFKKPVRGPDDFTMAGKSQRGFKQIGR